MNSEKCLNSPIKNRRIIIMFYRFINLIIGSIYIFLVCNNTDQFIFLKEKNNPLYAFFIIEIFCRFGLAVCLFLISRIEIFYKIIDLIFVLEWIGLILGLVTFYNEANKELR